MFNPKWHIRRLLQPGKQCSTIGHAPKKEVDYRQKQSANEQLRHRQGARLRESCRRSALDFSWRAWSTLILQRLWTWQHRPGQPICPYCSPCRPWHWSLGQRHCHRHPHNGSL